MAKRQYGMMNTKEFKAFSKGLALKLGWEGVEDQCPVKLEKPGCEGCGEDDAEGLKTCGKCQAVLYCGKKCQREDWKVRKRACRGSRK